MGKESENEYVPVLFTETQKVAEVYRRLLEDHEIKVLVGYDELEEEVGAVPEDIDSEEGVPVFVAAESLDEASEIISDFDDQDEFEEIEDEDDSEEDTEDDEAEFGMGPAVVGADVEEDDSETEDETDEFGDELLDEEDEEEDEDDYEFDEDEFGEFEEDDEEDDDEEEKY